MMLAGSLYTADLRGTIRSIDRGQHEIVVRQKPQPGMNADRSMLVRIMQPDWFRTLRVGQSVHLRCNESGIVPQCIQGGRRR